MGTVERTSLELAAPVSETVLSVEVSLGDRVEKGQVVVRLDSQVAEAELAAAQAALQAEEANQAAAEREYARIEGLRKARISSASDLDSALRLQDEARARVAERTARVTQANKRLEDLTVRARTAGTVDQLPFDPGERAPAGGVVAVVVADEEPWVRVWIPAHEVPRIPSGMVVSVEIPGMEESFEGRVDDIARESEYTPHYALTERQSAHLVFRARVRILGDTTSLRPGLPARVTIPLASSGE